MQDYFVLLDNIDGGQQATFSALHVAARTGVRLVGVAIGQNKQADEVKQLMGCFLTGARAAGVKSKTLVTNSFLSLDKEAFRKDIGAFFISRSSLKSATELEALMESVPCPVWIVPVHRSIRRLLAILNPTHGSETVLQQASILWKRWNLEFDTLLSDDLKITTEGKAFSFQAPPPLNSDNLLLIEQIARYKADLIFLSSVDPNLPLWTISTRLDSLLAVCPPTLNSF